MCVSRYEGGAMMGVVLCGSHGEGVAVRESCGCVGVVKWKVATLWELQC